MADPVLPQTSAVDLARLTPARVALGRCGASLPTKALLAFGLDHARARDAVHVALDADALERAVAGKSAQILRVRSQVHARADYLRRPDLGRLLEVASRQLLQESAGPACDIAIVLGDGLSPGAVLSQAPAVVDALRARLSRFSFAPLVIAQGARVALGDAIGGIFGARLVIMLIGERPGLSTPESLGAYLTFRPRPGLADADRNCISNIHAAGLSAEAAARRIGWLAEAALARGLSGVALKDDSAFAALPPAAS